MISRYLLLILALIVGGIAAFQLRADTGYVLLTFRGYRVETSLLGLIAFVSAAYLLLYYGLSLLLAGLRLPSTFRRNFERRKTEAARLSFELGISRLFEGRWRRAEIELVRRAADHHGGHLNYLAAARAAQRIGAPDRRDHYLALVAERAPRQKLVLLLTQAELQRERGEWAAVRDSALAMRALEPTHLYALELVAESLAALGDHAGLRTLLAEPLAVKALTKARWQALMLSSSLALMQQEVERADLAGLKRIWTDTPERIQASPDAARCYAQALARLNADHDARSFIEAHVAQKFDEPLVRQYGALHADDSVAQLAVLERWLQLHGEKPALLATAGAVCAKNRLWGRAASYLEAVVQVAPSPAAHLALAQLAEHTQQPEVAAQHYKRGLKLLDGS